MQRDLMCSSHTLSGVAPNSPLGARDPLDVRLRAASRAGYAGYWLHYRDYLAQRSNGLDDAAIGAAFDDAGLVHRGVEFLTDWFVDTAATREAEAAAYAAAQAIGAKIINVGADFLGRGFPRDAMIAAFERLCARASDFGLATALEIVPWSDVADVETALEFMTPANAGLVIDCWHVFRGAIPLAELKRIPPDRVLCVQVSDAAAVPCGPLQIDTLHRLPCGEGVFALQAFRDTLDQAGVDCPYSVEIISPEIAALSTETAARLTYDSARALF